MMTGINALCLLLATGLSGATARDELKPKLQAIYDEADSLLLKKDVKALAKFMGETRTMDFVFEGRSGKSNLQQSVRAMFVTLAGFDKVEKAKVEVVAVSQTGSTAVANVRTTLILKTKLIEKVVHTVEEDVYGTDTWVKQGAKWRLKLSKVVTARILTDGKPIKSGRSPS